MTTKRKNGLLFNLLLLTIFFNVWFPKAGIKIKSIPFTVGNVLFGLTFLMWIISVINKKGIKKSNIGNFIFLCLSYCLFKYVIVFAITNKFISSIGYIIPLIIYPLIFYVMFNEVDSEKKIEKIVKVIVYGYFFLCIYAILQYILGIDKCDIPGLTVNYSDYKEYGDLWFMTKSNGTDVTESKIVSTYQNGNLFGIGILTIYPIVYNFYKNKRNNKILNISLVMFIICVFFTLSRSCWLGIIIFILFEILLDNKKTKKMIIKKIVVIMLCIGSILVIFNCVPSITNRFLNTKIDDWLSMSGRTEGLISILKSVYESNSILGIIIGPYGISKYKGLAYEMFPLAIFVQLGVVGLILMYTIFIVFIRKMNKDNYIEKSVRLSITIWLIVGIIESGYWLPPVALNIFMLIGLGMAANKIYRKE